MVNNAYVGRQSKLSKQFKRVLRKRESMFVNTDIDRICKIPLRKKSNKHNSSSQSNNL